jgi:hypothetical protein
MSASTSTYRDEMDISYAVDFGRESRQTAKSRSRGPSYRRSSGGPARVSGMHCRRNKRWTWGSGRGARLMNLRAFASCVALALASLCSTVHAALPEFPIPDLYNTGVNAGGTALAKGASDPHWIVTASPANTSGGPVNHYNGAAKADWVSVWTSFTPNTGTSTWISAPNTVVVPDFPVDPVSGNLGLYTFQTTFTLPSDFVSARITGNWSADNLGGQVPDYNNNTPDPLAITNFVNLNGSPVAPGNLVYGFGPSSFEINSGFVPGLNVLQFNVSNLIGSGVPNPIGTQIVFSSATYAVPEPGTVALAATGLVGLGGMGLMRRRRAALAAGLTA